MSITGRITSKKLVDFVNSEFLRLEITEYECYDVERTRFRPYDYEGGACKLHVKLRRKDGVYLGVPLYFMCFYFLWEYEQYVKAGYEMFLTNKKRSTMLSILDMEIDLRKS